MKIVFDITRLLRRSAAVTPTGIDRVELAYARFLLRNYPDQSEFIGRLRSRAWHFTAGSIDGFVEATGKRWELSNALMSRNELDRVDAFLDLPRGTLGTCAGERVARRAIPAILPSLPGLLTPLNIWPDRVCRAFARGAVYLNVSHEGLSTRRDVDRLAAVRNLLPIYLVHDLIPLSHPEYVRPGDGERHEARMRTVLASAVATITNSEHTNQMLAAFAEQHNLPTSPVVVSPLGVEPEFFERSDLPAIDAPYFVMIGTIEPRKNHLTILHAWRHLVQALGPSAPKLLIIGRRGWENENVVDIIDRCHELRSHVLECNRMPDRVLRHIMTNARAVLMPSFAEGYGLPLAEALALGVPVLCSELSVFREIANDVPDYLDAIDGLGWVRAIMDYAAPESPRRDAQIERIRGFSAPTWDRHFKALETLVDAVQGSAQRSTTALRPSQSRKAALISSGLLRDDVAGAIGRSLAEPQSSTT